jgi:hypothetical protein
MINDAVGERESPKVAGAVVRPGWENITSFVVNEWEFRM